MLRISPVLVTMDVVVGNDKAEHSTAFTVDPSGKQFDFDLFGHKATCIISPNSSPDGLQAPIQFTAGKGSNVGIVESLDFQGIIRISVDGDQNFTISGIVTTRIRTLPPPPPSVSLFSATSHEVLH